MYASELNARCSRQSRDSHLLHARSHFNHWRHRTTSQLSTNAGLVHRPSLADFHLHLHGRLLCIQAPDFQPAIQAELWMGRYMGERRSRSHPIDCACIHSFVLFVLSSALIVMDMFLLCSSPAADSGHRKTIPSQRTLASSPHLSPAAGRL